MLFRSNSRAVWHARRPDQKGRTPGESKPSTFRGQTDIRAAGLRSEKRAQVVVIDARPDMRYVERARG